MKLGGIPTLDLHTQFLKYLPVQFLKAIMHSLISQNNSPPEIKTVSLQQLTETRYYEILCNK